MINLKNVTFKWHKSDSSPTLNIKELVIEKGERIFLYGPSGSGKSTLLAIFAGINTVTSGEVLILNKNLSTLSNTTRDAFRADHIGYIFQNFNLLPYLSPIENITLGCEFSKIRKQKILKQSSNKSAALQNEAIRLLNALGLTAQYHNKNVAELSIGQQQRVAAARAFIGSPELIIADEPTSALDTNNRESFIKLLFEQAKLSDSTLVFVSHDETLKPLFNRSIDLINLQEQV
jgi:putative ABC transport system ATP-binding protein